MKFSAASLHRKFNDIKILLIDLAGIIIFIGILIKMVVAELRLLW